MARRESARTERQIESHRHAAEDRLNNPSVGPEMPDTDRDAASGVTIEAATHLPSTSGRGAGGEGKKALDPALLAVARQLRQQQTDAERLLWSLLRDRRLAGFKFRRQHPIKPYVLDFYCHEAGLTVELDGGQHDEPEARARDERRTAYLAEHGIRVLRFWNNEVLAQTDAVLQAIYEALTPALSHGERERGE